MSNTDLDNTLQEIQQYKTAFINKFNQKGLKIGTNASLYQALNATSLVPGLNEAQELLSRVLGVVGTKSQPEPQIPVESNASSQPQEPAFDLTPYYSCFNADGANVGPSSGGDFGYIQIAGISCQSYGGYGMCSIQKVRYNYSSIVAGGGNSLQFTLYSTSYASSGDYRDWDGQSIPQVDLDSITLGSPTTYGDYQLLFTGSFTHSTSFNSSAQQSACAAGNPLKYNHIISGSVYSSYLGWKLPKMTWEDQGNKLVAIMDLSGFNGQTTYGNSQVQHSGQDSSFSQYKVKFNMQGNLTLQWSK